MKVWGVSFTLALTLVFAAGAGAEPMSRDEVPAPLAPWVDWVLRDAGSAVCPFVQGMPERRQCAWPARLELSLADRGGRFRQEWRLDRDAWVPLPGDRESWPQQVRVGERAAAVVPRDGVPSVRLPRGRHRVEGRYTWPRLPESLRIPFETGLLALKVRDVAVAFPDRDREGRLWLHRPAEETARESRLEVTVLRRVVDEIPLRLVTRVELAVSGTDREVVLARAYPDVFVPMSLRSPLPARIEADGRLRVQVRPGTWTLELVARHRGPVEALSLPPVEGPWSASEIWVFDARSNLRLVHVEGVPGIDPQRTRLPEDWKHLPAYLMEPGREMALVEKRRGDADPAPDQLELARTWWLDFDGGGYTVHDEIQGTFHRSWRLEMPAPTRLGRVAIGGRDQLISRRDGDGLVGIEVREGQARLDADSRVEGTRSPTPAVGWAHDFHRVSGTLNLPPGWRLFHASGVDDVRSAWTNRWSLLEIFLVLVTAMVVWQLFGAAWGGVALVTLALIYPESGAPRWIWLVLLAPVALLRVALPSRLRSAVQLARLGAIVLLAAIAIPFAVQQVRQAMYPALELPWLAIRGEVAKREGVVRAAAEEERDQVMALRSELPRSAPLEQMARGRLSYYAPDPTARVSTGPGLPHWGWRAVELGWRGPVEQTQQLRLVLIPPWANFALALLRVGLVVLLALGVVGVRLPRLWGRGGAAAALVAGLVCGGTLVPRAAWAELPSPELLAELREALLEDPECFPVCASSPRMRLEVSPRRLRARIEIAAGWETAVPLPGSLETWVPDQVLLDGAPARALARSPDGRLWLPVAAGTHQVTLDGPLPERDSVELPLPLRPHHVEASVSGWVLHGVSEGGLPEDSLELVRLAENAGAAATLEPTDLPPFVTVERRLKLGLVWRVSTRVVRVTPVGKTVFLDVPLLAGESVTTESVRVEDGVARLALPPRSTGVSWESLLDTTEGIELVAPDGVPWTEVWLLDAAPIWHVEPSGIPVVHRSATPVRVREWRPWPGERVGLDVTRPAGVDGRTLTIDRSALATQPGLRASDVTLTLALRASRGVQHDVALPPGVALQHVKIDGAALPIGALDGRVTLPIAPGEHTAEIAWRSPVGMSTRYVTDAPDLDASSVNAEVELAVPFDRWVLFVGGPRLGPAVLFWSLLAVVAVVAFGLGRLDLTPLGTLSWFLLLVGLTQVPIWASLVVAGWLLALGWRHSARPEGAASFNAMQAGLVLLTAAALLCLVWAIQRGLLGLPDMQISGNGSSGRELRWYADRSDGPVPAAWMISVPLWAYRLAMLAWALWLASALVRWLRWGWQCFVQAGLWRPMPRASRRRVVQTGSDSPS